MKTQTLSLPKTEESIELKFHLKELALKEKTKLEDLTAKIIKEYIN